MKLIDLHVHSTCSDGTMSPEEVAAYACQKGLSAFALTDHDTVEGIPRAQKAASLYQLEVIPGMELSTARQGRDIHILGLDIDIHNPQLLNALEAFRQERKNRNQKMIDRMSADGIDISTEQMLETFGDTLWTRAHFARYLAYHGYVEHMWDAFDTYIGDHCKYYVPRELMSPEYAVNLIRDTGGIPILAHPWQYHMEISELTSFLQELKSFGLLGIEAIYSTHTPQQELELKRIAGELDLCISGGSDFHGKNKLDIDLGTGKGNLKITYDILEQLREKRK